MTALFFRKERPNIFAERFSAPTPPANAWTLKSNTIFKAKSNLKSFNVTFKQKPVKVTCHVVGTNLQLSIPGTAKPIIIAEDAIATILESKKVDDLLYLAMKKICQDHATSSMSSPLISGCTVDNFDASKTYPGHKLCLELKNRKPFANPFVSGLEKECFLVGKVDDLDCKLIKYFGKTDEDFNEIVNFFGSKIQHPPR